MPGDGTRRLPLLGVMTMDPPTTFAEAADRRAELRCPDCGDPIICLWGCGWDYDRLVCSHYNCDWEHEYDTTTMAPDRTK